MGTSLHVGLLERFEARNGIPTRIVSDMRIPEVSIVTFPAYAATDVSVAQRSLQAFHAMQGTPCLAIVRHRVGAVLG